MAPPERAAGRAERCEEDEDEEEQARHALELGDLRLRVLALRAQARRLGQAGCGALEEWESEIETQAKAAEAPRERLAADLSALLEQHIALRPGTSGTTRVVLRELQESHKRVANLRKEQLRLEALARREEAQRAELDRKRLVAASMARSERARSAQVESERLRGAALEARAVLAERHLTSLCAQLDDLMEDESATREEVESLRSFTGSVKKERDRQAVLDRFVTKHMSYRAPGYLAAEDRLSIKTANRAVRTILDELAQVESALQAKAVSRRDSPHLIIARFRIQLDELHRSIHSALTREQDAANALVDLAGAPPVEQ